MMNFGPIVLLILCLSPLFYGCKPVVNKFAFFPNRRDTLSSLAALPAETKPLTILTSDHEKLGCFFLRDTNSNKLLIYFHGNAGNIDIRLRELEKLKNLGISVLGVGYRGYGKSTGKPSEDGVYLDGAAAYGFAVDSLGYVPKNIFILGRSIGTAVAVNTAQNKELAGVILITPFTNAREFAKSHNIGALTSIAGNPFDNISKCPNIKVPILIIHGTVDEVVPYALGVRLYDSIMGRKTFVRITGGRHNDLEFVDPQAYWGAIKLFLEGS